MWKIRHTTVIDWGWGGGGGWVGRVGVRGVEVGGLWSWGLRSGELGRGIGVGGVPILSNPPNPKPPTPIPPPAQPPLTSTPLTPTPTYHRCVANLPHRHCSKRLFDAYAQIVGHIRMSHLLCGESSLWQIFCGESAMWQILWQPSVTSYGPSLHLKHAPASFQYSIKPTALVMIPEYPTTHSTIYRYHQQVMMYRL